MKLQLLCSKGCGTTIEVGDDEIEEAKNAGVPLSVHHEICPTEKFDKLCEYRVRIEVWRTREVTNAEEWDELNASMENHTADESTSVWIEDKDDEDNDVSKNMVRELLTTVGGSLEAKDFSSAAEPLGVEMSKQWARVVNMAAVIDS